MDEVPDSRQFDESDEVENPDSGLVEQLERLHEQVLSEGTSDPLSSAAEDSLTPRLQAARQLLGLIEQVRTAESAGILDRSSPPADVLLVDMKQPLGPYRLIREIGRGGMGIVFLARDSRLDRNVAIKIVAPHRLASAEWLSQFQREARAASALNHPNILTVYEIGLENDQHYIATELVEGESLRAKILTGQMTMDQAHSYAEQLASAVAAAHSVGVVHRDLKPDNIMIREDGLLKVLDFGLAKYVPVTDANATDGRSASLTGYASQPGIILGTMRYMSPEQARGLPVDVRTDIFSLGVMLYEMLTGHHPFEAATSSDVLAAILDRAPLPLRELRTEVPGEIVRIVMRALSKDRDQRYPAATDLLRDLRQLKHVGSTEYGTHSQSVAGDARMPTRMRDAVELELVHQIEAADIPVVRYAVSGDVNIAFQVVGDGPFDLVFVMGWVSHLEWFWREATFAAFLNRLATFSRVILFDKRGTGLSDKVPVDQLPTLEQRMDDVRAVMEAVGSQRAVLCGVSEGGPMCTLFAATYPEKTIALAMIGCYARRLWAEDYPWGPTDQQRQHFLDEIRRDWGGPVGIDEQRAFARRGRRLSTLVGDLLADGRQSWRCPGVNQHERTDRHPAHPAHDSSSHVGHPPNGRSLPTGGRRPIPLGTDSRLQIRRIARRRSLAICG